MKSLSRPSLFTPRLPVKAESETPAAPHEKTERRVSWKDLADENPREKSYASRDADDDRHSMYLFSPAKYVFVPIMPQG